MIMSVLQEGDLRLQQVKFPPSLPQFPNRLEPISGKPWHSMLWGG